MFPLLSTTWRRAEYHAALSFVYTEDPDEIMRSGIFAYIQGFYLRILITFSSSFFLIQPPSMKEVPVRKRPFVLSHSAISGYCAVEDLVRSLPRASVNNKSGMATDVLIPYLKVLSNWGYIRNATSAGKRLSARWWLDSIPIPNITNWTTWLQSKEMWMDYQLELGASTKWIRSPSNLTPLDQVCILTASPITPVDRKCLSSTVGRWIVSVPT